MKKKFVTIAAILFVIMSANGQVSHGIWMGHVNIRAGGFLTNAASMLTMSFVGELAGKGQWLCPDVEADMRYNPLFAACWRNTWTQTIYDGESRIHPQNPRWWKAFLCPDFKNNYDVHIGYTIDYRSLDVPLGISIGVRCEWLGFNVTEGGFKGMHRTVNVLPTVGANWRVLGLDYGREHDWELSLRGDVFYVKNMWYNDPAEKGTGVVNDGIRASVGLTILYHGLYSSSSTLRYELDCFDFFNIPGVSTRFGRFVIGRTLIF